MNESRASMWSDWVQVFELLILIRVPLLLVLGGSFMVYYLPQFRELFDLALSRPVWGLWVWLFTGGLSLAAWYSARTLYSFDWPRRVENTRVQKMCGKVLPRVLATLLPIIMALVFLASTSPDGSIARWVWAVMFVAQAVALLLFTVFRRALIRRTAIGRLGKDFDPDQYRVSATPTVGRLVQWSDLGPARYIHIVAVAILLVSWVVGHWLPHWIDLIGSPGLVIGSFMMLVFASTAPVYFAARKRIPLITALVAWATLMTLIGFNDNHVVRLEAGADSDRDPPPGLNYTAGERARLSTFMSEWWDESRRERCNDQVYFISSEGGGIRAAMWTVLVLSELQQKTSGRLWECTLAVSGVSGGSLGLAAFASYMRENRLAIPSGANPLVGFLEDDFLAPVLGAMFGGDLFQRFLPVRLFTDRGQALEHAWVRGYRRIVIKDHSDEPSAEPLTDGLELALAETVRAKENDRWLTALFLNTTLVDSGMRLIQHPFASLDSEKDVASPFPGAEDGAAWLPAELPVFSAVHNSARFTLVSPAGTILKRDQAGAGDTVRRLGQVVDGGYFENSGATTLQALITGYREMVARRGGPGKFRVIHISNDVAVPPFALNGADACSGLEFASGPPAGQAPLFGEARAPLVAILQTRDARGQFARQALLDSLQHLDDGRLWHYRLCPGRHQIPLGWTIGEQTTEEMRRQLDNGDNDEAAGMVLNTGEIVGQFQAAEPASG
ncbi:MAG: hypothetical protein ABR612_03225 [Chromatocurvus sp.]